ncbi:MAG TPA: sigma-70 family RNA polymerase sigma factor [Ktedonobacteraceae bacterium]|nr:sigma-70 family RNA polymerase sigma factor [Ktedonobacteraceae bacterium]
MSTSSSSPKPDKDGLRRITLDEAYREYVADLYRYIYSKVGQAELAEDLTSYVFLKAMRWLQQDRTPESVRGWLYATARTTIADHWHEQGQVQMLPLDKVEDMVADNDDAQVQAGRAQERVQRLLKLLPTRESHILTLRYLQGYSAAEVAQALGLSAGNVRVLQLRALRRAAQLEADERSIATMGEAQSTPYTEQTNRVIELAREEAIALGHNFVGTEHLLLGVLREGTVTPILDKLGASLERVRAGVTFIYGGMKSTGKAPSFEGSSSEPGLTPRSQKALDLAGDEAQRMGETAISPGHVFLGLLREGTGIAAGMLHSLDIELEQARVAIKNPAAAAKKISVCSLCRKTSSQVKRMIPLPASLPLREELPPIAAYICNECITRLYTMLNKADLPT